MVCLSISRILRKRTENVTAAKEFLSGRWIVGICFFFSAATEKNSRKLKKLKEKWRTCQWIILWQLLNTIRELYFNEITSWNYLQILQLFLSSFSLQHKNPRDRETHHFLWEMQERRWRKTRKPRESAGEKLIHKDLEDRNLLPAKSLKLEKIMNETVDSSRKD